MSCLWASFFACKDTVNWGNWQNFGKNSVESTQYSCHCVSSSFSWFVARSIMSFVPLPSLT